MVRFDNFVYQFILTKKKKKIFFFEVKVICNSDFHSTDSFAKSTGIEAKQTITLI